jgi:hypothetical protein
MTLRFFHRRDILTKMSLSLDSTILPHVVNKEKITPGHGKISQKAP